MDDLISRLSELRCQYNCFDENERNAYHTLSEAIKALSDVPDTNIGDTINRQVAIERIVRIRPSTPKQSDYSHGVDVGMAMAIVAIEEQPSAHTELRWIPVEEKLPEVGERVLVTLSLIKKYSRVEIARYGEPMFYDKVCFYVTDSEIGDCELSGVTAWMPLPKTYERRNYETN